MYDTGEEVNLPNGHGAHLQAIPEPKKADPIDYSHMIAVISAWSSILNARLLAVLSLMGTLGGFAWCMGEPSPMRLYGLAIYAILCQFPILYLYLRKG